MRFARALTACLLALLPVLGVGAPPAAAAPPARIAAQVAQPPAPPKKPELTYGLRTATKGKPDRRGVYTYSLPPGGAVTDFLSVENSSLRSLALQIYASDAVNTPDGGFNLLEGGTKPVDVGSWVGGLGRPVVVPARGATIVPFRIRVPKDAAPGDHVGGIVASFTTKQRDAAGNDVTVDNRVGVRIYLRVAGRLEPRLAIENLKVTYDATLNPVGSGAATVSYTVRNVGNVRLGAIHEVTLTNPFGWSRGVPGFAPQEQLLPGNAVNVSGTANGVFAAIQLKASVRVEPQGLRGDINPPLNDELASTRVWTIPWMLLALVVAVWATSRELRRRRRKGTRRRSRGSRPAIPTRAPATSITAPPAAPPSPVRSPPSRPDRESVPTARDQVTSR